MSARTLTQVLVFTLAAAGSLAAMAGQGAIGEITHSPTLPPAAVPALGGLGLLVLAVLLGLSGLRLSRADQGAGSKWLMAGCIATALASGSSGVKLIGDAYAAGSAVTLETASGETLEFDIFDLGNGASTNGGTFGSVVVENLTGTTQFITNITLQDNCQIIPEDHSVVVNAGGGGYEGPCSDQPPTSLPDGATCDLDICCDVLVTGPQCDDLIVPDDINGS